jgi:hypothetical protein
MKVFISWSGERSGRVAQLLREWLQCVIQSVDPWVSSKDIDRGSLWFSEISQQLGETTVGILCLTQENKEKPWILFEAGALAKGLNSSRVCTLLIDLEPKDIGDPLAQFNHTKPNKAGIGDLVRTLNAASGSKLLDDQVLIRVFETYWPQFEAEFAQIIKETPAHAAKPRPKDDVLTEILEATRSMSGRIRKIEEQQANLLPSGEPANTARQKSMLRRLSGDELKIIFSDKAASELKRTVFWPQEKDDEQDT